MPASASTSPALSSQLRPGIWVLGIVFFVFVVFVLVLVVIAAFRDGPQAPGEDDRRDGDHHRGGRQTRVERRAVGGGLLGRRRRHRRDHVAGRWQGRGDLVCAWRGGAGLLGPRPAIGRGQHGVVERAAHRDRQQREDQRDGGLARQGRHRLA